MPHVPGRRGAFGDWLKTERERRYRTQADALRAFRKLAGLTIAPSEYAQWESGSRTPKAENPKRLALYAFFGSREDAPAIAASVVSTTDPALLAILTRQAEATEAQTAAINALVKRLDDLAAGQLALADEVGMVVDPDLIRRRLEAERSESGSVRRPRGSRPGGARPWEGESPEPAGRRS